MQTTERSWCPAEQYPFVSTPEVDLDRVKEAVRQSYLAWNDAEAEFEAEDAQAVHPAVHLPRHFGELFEAMHREPATVTRAASAPPASADTAGRVGPEAEVVIARGLPLFCMCSEHLLPYIGRAHVAYLEPGGRVRPLVKVERLLHELARRPQTQAALTERLADAIRLQAGTNDVAVVVVAEHMCLTVRGAATPARLVRTTATRGRFAAETSLGSDVLDVLSGR